LAIMRLSPVELIFNLGWLAVAIFLWGLWLSGVRGAEKKSLLPAVAVQAVALAMLTAILLPVISITDDLHSCQLPAEVKRSVLQGDRQLAPAAAPGMLPVSLALLALCMNLLRPRRLGMLAVDQPGRPQAGGYVHSLWSRPPPAAMA
jgi:hypothetical protein